MFEARIVPFTVAPSDPGRRTQFGADEVVKAEQVVARQFYEMLLRKIGRPDAAMRDR